MMAAVNARAAAVAVVGCALAGCAASPPVLPAYVQPDLPPQVELDDTPFFAQQRYQCGPAALATVLAASGVEVTADELVPEVYLPGRRGSLQAGTGRSHPQPRPVPYVLPPETSALLAEVAAGEPVLVLQKIGAGPWPGWHYAVVVGYDASRDRSCCAPGLEPPHGNQRARFLASWHRGGGWALATLQARRLPPQAGFRALHDGGRRTRGRVAVTRPRCAPTRPRHAIGPTPRCRISRSPISPTPTATSRDGGAGLS